MPLRQARSGTPRHAQSVPTSRQEPLRQPCAKYLHVLLLLSGTNKIKRSADELLAERVRSGGDALTHAKEPEGLPGGAPPRPEMTFLSGPLSAPPRRASGR
jgi:hypothetical protein